MVAREGLHIALALKKNAIDHFDRRLGRIDVGFGDRVVQVTHGAKGEYRHDQERHGPESEKGNEEVLGEAKALAPTSWSVFSGIP